MFVIMASRFLIGAGTSSIGTTTFAMLSSLYPEKVSMYIGKIELSIGIGLIVGPFFGTIIYDYFGFAMNYWIFVCLYLVEFLLALFLLPGKRLSSKKKIKEENKLISLGINPKEHFKNIKHLQVSYSKLILNKGSFFALLTVLIDVIQWTFFDPILTS